MEGEMKFCLVSIFMTSVSHSFYLERYNDVLLEAVHQCQLVEKAAYKKKGISWESSFSVQEWAQKAEAVEDKGRKDGCEKQEEKIPEK